MKSLQGRFIFMSVTILLLCGIVASLGGYRAAKMEVDEVLDEQLSQIAQTLLFFSQADEFGSSGDIGRGIPLGHSQMVFQIWQLKSIPNRHPSLSWSDQSPGNDTYPRLMLRSSAIAWDAASFEADGFRTVQVAGQPFRFLTTTSPNGEFRVIVGQDLIDRDEMVRDIAWTNTWPFLLVLPIGVIALVWSTRRSLAPVRRLAAELADREPDHLARLEIADAPSELWPLLGALNRLLVRLEETMEHERRFTGDAAHELRTPMAALRAQLDALRLANNKDSRIQAQVQASASLERMVRLINQLLTLARVDHAASERFEPIDITHLAREVCAEMAPRALATKIDLALIGEAAIVQGEEEGLRILLRNLLDNALRYGRSGDRIEVRVETVASRVALTVIDSGPGVPDERRKELGERFNRLGNQLPGGAGLGLSIVARIAQRYGAQVSFEPGLDGGGLAVRIVF